MDIRVSGVHFEITDAVRTYAVEKTDKLSRIYDGVTEAEILLKAEDRAFHCEIIVRAKNKHRFVIDVAHENMYAAIDQAVDKIQRQLRRHKEKLVEHHHQHHQRPDRAARGAEGAETPMPPGEETTDT